MRSSCGQQRLWFCHVAANLPVMWSIPSFGGATSTSANNVLCLLTFVWRCPRIAMTLSTGVPPLVCSQPGLCCGAVLKGHKAVRCDSCDMWIHNECSFIAETQYETVNNTNCTWICPKCEFFNFSDSFFGEQVNLETENRFVPLTKREEN